MSIDVFKRLQEYVGREYRAGLYDCAHLAADVQRDLFGKEIALPTQHPMGTAGQRALVNGMRDELAIQIVDPVNGCAALLKEQTDAGCLLHIGTVALYLDEAWVLHNSAKLGSAHLHRLKDLNRWGMSLSGYFQWK